MSGSIDTSAATTSASTAPGTLATLVAAQAGAALSTDDVLVLVLPLFEQVAALHAHGRVAALEPGAIVLDPSGALRLRQPDGQAPTMDLAAVHRVQPHPASALNIVGELRRSHEVEGREHLARARGAQGSGQAMAHGHAHRRGAILHPDDDRPAAAPDGGRHRAAGAQRQAGHLGNHQTHRVQLLQADQAQLHGQRPQAVVPTQRVLLNQPHLAKTHQIGMRLGRRQAGRTRQVFQGHGAARTRQRLQQLAAHFNALDAPWPAPAGGLGVVVRVVVVWARGGGVFHGGQSVARILPVYGFSPKRMNST